jgi:hypothetical protein
VLSVPVLLVCWQFGVGSTLNVPYTIQRLSVHRYCLVIEFYSFFSKHKAKNYPPAALAHDVKANKAAKGWNNKFHPSNDTNAAAACICGEALGCAMSDSLPYPYTCWVPVTSVLAVIEAASKVVGFEGCRLCGKTSLLGREQSLVLHNNGYYCSWCSMVSAVTAIWVLHIQLSSSGFRVYSVEFWFLSLELALDDFEIKIHRLGTDLMARASVYC